MGAVERILVAVKDPSARSLPAVLKGVQLARALGAQLELYHAIDSPLYVEMFALSTNRLRRTECDEREEFLQRLERIAARARLHARAVTVAAEWDYPVYEAIVRRALRIGADLIVAECHAGRHVAAGLLQLADWELLRLSPVPVLLVKRARPYHHPTVLAAIDPTHAFSKPAKLDREILRLGGLVANGLRGRLHAVHAYGRTLADMLGPATTAASAVMPTVASAGFNQALRSSDVATARRHLVAGDPCGAVEETARRVRADIVVAGAISRSGLKRAFIGNTAERLLDRLRCDLLIVKPADFSSSVPRAVRGPRLTVVEPLG
jgi:universal stress protein E